MKKLILFLLLSVSGFCQTNIRANNGTFNGKLVIGGPSPWYDVTSSVYGSSTCTGSGHDDTPAFLAAATAANTAGGGTVLVPVTSSGCFWNTALVITGFQNVRFKGTGGPQWLGTSLAPKITCAVTGSGNCLTASGTVGIEIDHLNIVYNNAGFTGSVLNFSNNGGTVSQGIYVHDSVIQGTVTATGAAQLINITNADQAKIEFNHFHYAANGINPQGVTGVKILHNDFSSATGTLSNAAIKSSGANMLVEGNVIELGTALGNISILDCSVSCGSNNTFIGNWAGDAPAGWNGTLFKGMGAGSSYNFYGNNFNGGSGLSGKFFANTGGITGLTFTGNWVTQWGTLFQIDAALNDVMIAGNLYQSITNFKAGSIGVFNSGYVEDNATLVTLLSVKNVDGFETTAPSGNSGHDLLYPDSTAHRWKMINNNGSAVQVVASGADINTSDQVTATHLSAPPSYSGSFQFGCNGTATAGSTLFLFANGSTPTTCTDTNGGGIAVVPSAGTVTNLRCRAGTGGVNASSGVVTIQKQAVDQALTCTFGTTGLCSDANQAHNFSIAAGESLRIKYTTQAAETLANITCAVEKF